MPLGRLAGSENKEKAAQQRLCFAFMAGSKRYETHSAGIYKPIRSSSDMTTRSSTRPEWPFRGFGNYDLGPSPKRLNTMPAITLLERAPIDFSRREIRILDFSRTLYPCFEDGKASCSLTTISLRRRIPPKYTIIAQVASPGEELVECLVVDGQPVSVSAGLARTLKTLSEQRLFLSMSFPVRLWIEEVCVDREGREEQGYLQSMYPGIYGKAASLMYDLGSGDAQIHTFLKVAHLIFWRIHRCSSRDLVSWRSTFKYLRKCARAEAGMPRTLIEFSELATYFFKHPFWNTMRSLQEYLSAKAVGLIYEDVVLWDCMLLEVGMMALQQEGGYLPREKIPSSGIVAGAFRDALLKGLRSWRRLVQWELVRSFLRLHVEGKTPLAWHYLAQLAPQLCAEDEADKENTYLYLASCMLQYGHVWPEPLQLVVRTGNRRQRVPLRLQGLLHWLASANKLCASEATSPVLSPSVTLDDMISVSRTHLSESRLFFLTHAGVGLHDRPDDTPSWVPDYDAISRSPPRVPLTFEDPRTYADPDYHRYNPTMQRGALLVLGAQMGQLVEVHGIPEPSRITELFAFLHTFPPYEIISPNHRGNTRRLVGEILLALNQDPHHPPTGAALHRCVGTLLLSVRGPKNPLFRLLDLSPEDEMTAIVDQVHEVFLPDVDESATNVYGWDEASRKAAKCLSEERIKDVREFYGLGRVEGGSWELVPRRARVGDGVFKVKGYGAGVVLRGVEEGYRLVGACGVDVSEFEVLKGCWKRVVIR